VKKTFFFFSCLPHWTIPFFFTYQPFPDHKISDSVPPSGRRPPFFSNNLLGLNRPLPSLLGFSQPLGFLGFFDPRVRSIFVKSKIDPPPRAVNFVVRDETPPAGLPLTRGIAPQAPAFPLLPASPPFAFPFSFSCGRPLRLFYAMILVDCSTPLFFTDVLVPLPFFSYLVETIFFFCLIRRGVNWSPLSKLPVAVPFQTPSFVSDGLFVFLILSPSIFFPFQVLVPDFPRTRSSFFSLLLLL